ncbi:hypothetical protein ACFXO9_09600 [Nocardia tengchongensis]|uniref:DUF7257 domain-containing protein n=1 Tax=Nocardia tengchongensis TaxID=2055889 RepID=UPI0036A1426F
MTSPDRFVPAGAYTGTASGNISALQAVTMASAQQAAVSTVASAFVGVSGAGSSMNAATQNALNAATNAQSGAGTANSTANAAQGSTAANSTAINDLLAGQKAQDTGGSVFTDNFNRPTLGPDYRTFKWGPIADLVVANGEVGINQNGDQDNGWILAVNTAHQTETDDQAVSAVMGSDRNSDLVGAILIARAASDLSTFVAAIASRNNVWLGRGWQVGGNVYFRKWGEASVPVHTGDTVTLDCVGTAYQVLVNGASVTSAEDPGKVSPVEPANRFFGFGCQYGWTGIRWSFSFNIAGLTAADLAAPTVSGTGWSLRCMSNSISAPSGQLRFPANTFDADYVPPSNVQILDHGLGRVQVNKAGWYAISLGYNLTTATGVAGADLWWAPSAAGNFQLLRSGFNSGVANSAAAETFTVYLAAGSVVCPGYYLSGNSTITGPNTYFDGAFISY